MYDINQTQAVTTLAALKAEVATLTTVFDQASASHAASEAIARAHEARKNAIRAVLRPRKGIRLPEAILAGLVVTEVDVHVARAAQTLASRRAMPLHSTLYDARRALAVAQCQLAGFEAAIVVMRDETVISAAAAVSGDAGRPMSAFAEQVSVGRSVLWVWPSEFSDDDADAQQAAAMGIECGSHGITLINGHRMRAKDEMSLDLESAISRIGVHMSGHACVEFPPAHARAAPILDDIALMSDALKAVEAAEGYKWSGLASHEETKAIFVGWPTFIGGLVWVGLNCYKVIDADGTKLSLGWSLAASAGLLFRQAKASEASGAAPSLGEADVQAALARYVHRHHLRSQAKLNRSRRNQGAPIADAPPTEHRANDVKPPERVGARAEQSRANGNFTTDGTNGQSDTDGLNMDDRLTEVFDGVTEAAWQPAVPEGAPLSSGPGTKNSNRTDSPATAVANGTQDEQNTLALTEIIARAMRASIPAVAPLPWQSIDTLVTIHPGCPKSGIGYEFLADVKMFDGLPGKIHVEQFGENEHAAWVSWPSNPGGAFSFLAGSWQRVDADFTAKIHRRH